MFRPEVPMRADASPLLTSYGDTLADPMARSELRGWCALAILSLAVAGVFALLLAFSRTPGVGAWVPWPAAFFGKGLVVHVVFAFIVWFLAVLGTFLNLAAWRVAGGRPPLAWAGRGGLVLAAIACVLLFVPALLDRGEPTLNNYVPAIIDPVYYAGLGVLALGLTLPVARLLAAPVARLGGPSDDLSVAALGAAVVFCLALVCFGLAYGELAGQAPSYAFNEELFWGGGHLLQFISTILLVGAWSALARLTLAGEVFSGRLAKGAIVFLIVCALPAPAFYFIFPPFAAEQTMAFSGLLWALGPPTLVVAAAGLLAIRRRGRLAALPWRNPVFLSLVLSIGVFGLGGVLGMFIDGADTRTPAHYHAVIAGVTLSFMGLFLGLFLPLLGRAPRPGRRLSFLVIAFAAGQTLACIGLFIAGGHGAPRKVAGDAQGLIDISAIVGMSLNGVGALVAVSGGLMFIWVAGKALFGRAAPAE
jgi:heme/copper-type cytochrome/quinol oxidase subunit 1